MIIKHRSPEWYKARIGKFTASNFGVLMSKAADGSDGWSKSAMNCIIDLARQLYENEYHERPDNDATRWGINHEAKAIQEFSRASGLEVADAGFVLHPDFPDVGATPDTIVIDKTQCGKLILAQIKCPYCTQNHLDYTRKIKDSTTLRRSKLHYYWQIQGEMWVAGASHSYFVSYDPRLTKFQQIHYAKIERDEEAIEQLKQVILRAIASRNEILKNLDAKRISKFLKRDKSSTTTVINMGKVEDYLTNLEKPPTNSKHVPFLKKNGTYMVVDSATLNPIPWKQEFDDAIILSEGFIRVELDGFMGLIDKEGNKVIPLKYDNIYRFVHERAIVEANNKYGFIDKTGIEVIPIIYDEVWNFCGELAPVRLNGKWGVIDETGNEVLSFIYDSGFEFRSGYATVKLNNKYGIIDKTCKTIVPFIYDFIFSFKEGLAIVKLNNKYGFIDISGTVIIPIIYDHVENFPNEYVGVQINYKWGLLDKKGNVIINPKYDSGGGMHFCEGLLGVRLNGKYGFINLDGDDVIPMKYDFAGNFHEGLAVVKVKDKYGVIDKSGIMVVQPIYDDYGFAFFEGLLNVKFNDKWGYIDKTGEEIIPINYDFYDGRRKLVPFSKGCPLTWFYEGFAKVRLNDQSFYIDKAGIEFRGN